MNKTFAMYRNLKKLKKTCLLTLLTALLFSPACKKDNCNSDFSTTYNNGGMAPELVNVSASEDSQDAYEWDLDGLKYSGNPNSLTFSSSGIFNLSLDVSNGDKNCQSTDVIDIRDYPYQGFVSQGGSEAGRSISYFEADGRLYTKIFDLEGAEAINIPGNEPLNPDGRGGLDYDDANNRLYVTPNFGGSTGVTVGSCFPNGVDVQLIDGEDDFGITDLIIDDEKQEAYYATRIGGSAQVKRISLAGGDAQFVAGNLSVQDIFIAIDRQDAHLFWSNGSCIGRINMDTGQGGIEFGCGAFGDERTGAMVFDNTSNVLYYGQTDELANSASHIYRLDLSVSEPIPEIFVNLASAGVLEGIAFDEENQELFWSDANDNTIKKLNLSTDEIQIIVENVARPRGLGIGVFK